jgi:S-adenosylmethionine-diacylgycerolhomoserine-N-methlytransferase
MDRQYRWQRHLYDLTRPLLLPGRDRALRGIRVPADGSVLEIGCGTGRNLRVLAASRPGISLYGLDVSPEMLRTAGTRVSAAQRDRIILAPMPLPGGDLRRACGRSEPFDAILFSYSLSMMPDRAEVLRLAVSALAGGGTLHLVDFGGCDRWPAPARAAALAWLRAWHVVPRPTGAEILRGMGLAVTEEPKLGGYVFIAQAR